MKKEQIRKLALLPVIFSIGFLPLIMQMVSYTTGLDQYSWFPNDTSELTDIFLISKAHVLMVIGTVMAVILFVYCAVKKVFPGKAVIPLAVYCLMVLISGILSINREFAFFGSYERFEPVGVLLSYAVLCVYALVLISDWTHLRWVLMLSIFGIMIVCGIGLLQAAGADPIKSDLASKLISFVHFGSGYDANINVIMEGGRAYSTLYNPDYISMYSAALFPVALAAGIAEKKKVWKVIFFISAVMLIALFYFANVRAGWFAIAASIAFGLLVFAARNKKAFLVMILICVAGAAGMVAIIFRYSDVIGRSDLEMGDHAVENLVAGDNGVIFELSDGRELSIAWYDDNGIKRFLVSDDAIYNELGGSIYPEYIEDAGMLISITLDGQVWKFTDSYDNTVYFINPASKLVKIEENEKVDWFNDGFLSGRGRIWNYSIPLLKNYMVKGSGADTFILVYPQNRYVERVYDGDSLAYDVKPHSYYLEQWIEEGFIAFLALMIFYIWYIIDCILIYRKANLKDPMALVGFGCFIGVTGSLITFITNDSNVCTTPVFWGVLGIGMACNRVVRKAQFPKKVKAVEVEASSVTETIHTPKEEVAPAEKPASSVQKSASENSAPSVQKSSKKDRRKRKRSK